MDREDVNAWIEFTGEMPPVSAGELIRHYCGRDFAPGRPPEIEKAFGLVLKNGYMTTEAMQLCDPHRVPVTVLP